MNPIDDTTYSADPVEHLETVVGDEMQAEALPRVKIKGWNNEVNLSVGVIYDETPHTMILDGNKAIWEQGDVSASFEPLVSTTTPDTHISLIDEGEISPQRIAAEYEVDRYFRWGQTVRIHKSNEKAMMYYGPYNANEFLDRSKLDIPEVRLSPTNWNDPMTMDNELVLIDVHYDEKRDDLEKLHNSTITAIKEVLAKYGVTAYHTTDNVFKLYYKDGDKDVKFFSTGFFSGHYYYYINIGHDYNGALAYSNDPNAVPRNDTNAYGLKTVADVPDNLGTEIIERYAELYGLPLVPRVFTPAEEAKIAEIEIIHNNENWIVNGKRDDVWRLTASEQNEPGFEFDITLATKPDTNVYTMSIETKGLVFSKQATIPDELVKTDYRSPRVVGSYAVYHESKQNNEYKAGKAFHIYRPIIKDATGWEVWGDIDIDTEMRITIPQNFIDNATYPIVIDPTFGYTTIGASTVSSENMILASGATLAADGNLATITGSYSGSWAPAQAIQGAVYDSNGSLLYTSTATTGSVVSFASPPTLSATSYRIALATDYNSTYDSSIAYDSVTGTSYSLSQVYAANSFPAAMTSFTTETTRLYTIYGTTSIGYQWPVMMGNSQAMAATTRYMPMDGGSSTTWTTTAANQAVVSPFEGYYSNFRFDVTTAPGVGTARTMSVSGNLSASISDLAVTGSSTGAVVLAAGTNLYIQNVPIFTPASSTGNKWRLNVTSANQAWYSSSIAALSTTATRYMGVQEAAGLSTSTAQATSTMPNDSGTIKTAYCKLLDGTLTGAGTYTVTLVKGGVDTAISMVLDSSNAFKTSASTVAVTGTTPASADTLYWKIVPSAGTAPSAALRVAISCEYLSDTAGRGIVFGGDSVNVSGTTYSSSYDAWNATESLISSLSVTHTIIALRADLSAAPSSTNTRTLTLRKNAADQTPAITITSTAVTGSWSGSLAVATDDLIAFSHTSTGTPANSSLFWSYVFTAPAGSSSGLRLLAMTGVGK